MRSEPKFYLKNNKADDKTPIILNLKVHNNNFRYSTQKSIEPELWDKETQRPTRERKLLTEYKKAIPTLKEDLKDISNRLINLSKDTSNYLSLLEQQNKILDFEELRNYLDSKYKKVKIKEKEKMSFNNFLNNYIDGIEKGKIFIDSGVNYGKKYKPSTIKGWKEWRTQIDNFQEYYGKLKWEKISMDTYEELINFFYSKNYSINAVGKQIKNLKSTMRRAYEEGLHSNEIFRNKNFKVLTEEIDKVTLTQEELDKLADVKLNDKKLDLSRDVFLIGCYSALRISDIRKLKKSHIIKRGNNNFIKLRTEKTEEEVIIPISQKLYSILDKYNFTMPKINLQELRLNIKTICKMVNIDEGVEIKSSKGGVIKYTTKPKYEMISAHSARRTGATLMFLSGVKPLLIQKITGHRKESSLMKYINISKEEAAFLIATNPYFV